MLLFASIKILSPFHNKSRELFSLKTNHFRSKETKSKEYSLPLQALFQYYLELHANSLPYEQIPL